MERPLSRRVSLSNSAKKVFMDRNQLEGELNNMATIHVENIVDAKQISPEELEDVILSSLRFTE